MSDYLDRLEEIERTFKHFEGLRRLLEYNAPREYNLGVITPVRQKLPYHTGESSEVLFKFMVNHREGIVNGLAWDSWSRDTLLFILELKGYELSCFCAPKEVKGRERFRLWAVEASGKYLDIFSFLEEREIKDIIHTVYNRIAEVRYEMADTDTTISTG